MLIAAAAGGAGAAFAVCLCALGLYCTCAKKSSSGPHTSKKFPSELKSPPVVYSDHGHELTAPPRGPHAEPKYAQPYIETHAHI